VSSAIKQVAENAESSIYHGGDREGKPIYIFAYVKDGKYPADQTNVNPNGVAQKETKGSPLS